jgi:hypothetical protein
MVRSPVILFGALAVLALAVSATAWHAFHDRIERSRPDVPDARVP